MYRFSSDLLAVNTLKEQYILLLIFGHLINKIKDIENFLD